MGDDRRGRVFAQYIVKQFPKAREIFDVAGGKGQVARSLANKRRNVLIIDPKPRLEGRSHKRIRYEKASFTEDYREPKRADLVVGMHPDEATVEIILYAARHNIPFAVVPCCIKGRHSANLRFTGWIAKLKSLARQAGFQVSEARLSISGKNTVIMGRPGKR